MQETQEVDGSAIKAGGYSAVVLELVETAFDGVANLVSLEVIGDRAFSGWIAGDHRLGTHVLDEGSDCIGIIGFIGKHPQRLQAVQQGGRYRGIATLTRCQDQSQRAAQGIDGEVYLGRQTASGSPQSLAPPFEPFPVAAC